MSVENIHHFVPKRFLVVSNTLFKYEYNLIPAVCSLGRIPMITGSALQIPDAQLTASGSYASAVHVPSMARMSSLYCWAADSTQAWIQADFGKILLPVFESMSIIYNTMQ